MTVTFFSLHHHHHHSFPPLSSTTTTLSHRHHHRHKTIVTKSCLKKNPSIFLPHLHEQKQVKKPTPKKDEPIITDPIHKFFKSQTSNQNPDKDPQSEGKFTLQKNRRTSWHLAKSNSEADPDDDFDLGTKPRKDFEQSSVFHGVLEENGESLVKFGPDPGGESGSGVKPRKEFEKSSVFHGDFENGPDPGGEFGSGEKPRKEFAQRCVDGVIELAKNLAENVTLGEVLGGYEGKLSERECVEVLSLMGEEEGLVMCCLYFFEWMSLHEPSLVTPWAYSALFPVLGRAGLGDKLLILFDNLPATVEYKQVHVFNSAISALSDCGRYDDAWSIFETMEQCNVEPDHVTCSIMITIMRRKGNSAKDAWEFFEILNMRGLKWSLEVMGALIKAFCDEGLKKEALIIQLEMEKKGIASNAIIYNTIINAYSKSDQIEEAEGLFAEMKSKGITPTTASYNILMDAYSRRMQPEVIEKLMVEMEEIGLQPDVKSFTCLISAYGRQKKMSDMAADAFLKMKKFGIKPTSHSYTALIHAYSISGWHEKADVAFQNMLREGVKPSIETYTALLDAFRRAGDTEALMRIWKRMITDKVEGTRVTFNILVDGFAKQGQYSEARDVICEFGRIGLQPTVMTYNMLINAYARGGQESKLPQLLKEMTVLKLKPDSITYSTMIYAFVRVRDFKRAFYYHKQMVKSGQVPDARSYHKLRSILDVKAATKNKKDKSAIMGIISSKLGWVKIKKKAKKDEFWKNKKKWSRTRGSDSAASRS